ncbi:MAG: hypothetical protein ACI4HQ_05375 [Acetatifactor sp.]
MGEGMEFRSILDLKDSGYQNGTRPAFFTDLNLPGILEQIQSLYDGDVAGYYYYFPADEACEAYRRQVYGEVGRPEVFALLQHFVGQMKDVGNAAAEGARTDIQLQRQIWFVQEVEKYCSAIEELYRELQKAGMHSEGFCLFLDYLQGYLEKESYRDMRSRCSVLTQELEQIRFTLHYENRQIVVTEGEMPSGYEAFLMDLCPGHTGEMKSPFGLSSRLSSLETEIYRIYANKHMDMIRRMEEFAEKYADYGDERLLTFSREIGFYLSYQVFQSRMEGYGFCFATPTTKREEPLQAAGLYDLALAVAVCREERAVVPNDFEYREGERFFVLTGPNQGGKTTFARSLGQLVYFAKLGLSVPAKQANVPYFKGILTHFSVEESIETGRGKLKEELVRLAPMMDTVYENTFVIINELFTTAANFDACIMGGRVLDHFLAQRCMGIYVTHLRELSEGREGVVSLRASLDENRVQTFRVLRSPASDAPCAANQVNKYRLGYAQLKERLS